MALGRYCLTHFTEIFLIDSGIFVAFRYVFVRNEMNEEFEDERKSTTSSQYTSEQYKKENRLMCGGREGKTKDTSATERFVLLDGERGLPCSERCQGSQTGQQNSIALTLTLPLSGSIAPFQIKSSSCQQPN